MARIPRREVLDPHEVAVAHAFSRTVRQCFLLGKDRNSGKDYDYRKDWIEDLLEHFAAHFGIDLIAFAILSNHYHLILRSRPDVVNTWTDIEVARRWMMICPLRKKDGKAEQPTTAEIDAIRNDPAKLHEIRTRLSDISWWMRLLNQRIAQRSNKEDGVSGHFFEDRYKAVRLLDEASVLACSAYVDLNPIRAALAENLVGSKHTSAQRRAISSASRRKAAAKHCHRELSDSFLAPVKLDNLRQEPGPCPSTTNNRCSDKGFACISAETYLELLDWTAQRKIHEESELIPNSTANVLARLGLTASSWFCMANEFGRLFRSVAGMPSQIDAERSLVTKKPFRVARKAREVLESLG